jgi:hypothetical protein
VQNELWRLDRSGPPNPSAYTLGACASCNNTLAFGASDWFLTCSCAYRTLHPQRLGELRARKWRLIVRPSTEEGAENWCWTLLYWAAFDETPPEGTVRLKLWREQQEWLFLYGASHRSNEKGRLARERTITWYGSSAEGIPAIWHSATRAFVEPWYVMY